MFLCLKLFLAHLIADFILQFEELYQLKTRSKLGFFLHVVVHFVVSILIVSPYLNDPFIWIFLALIATIHYFQDRIKYSLQKKNPEKSFIYFSVDQAFHFLFISTILFFPISKAQYGFPNNEILNYLYTDNFWTFCLMAWIFTTFGTSYWLHTFRRCYLKDSRPDHLITSFEMTHAIIERSFITFTFLLGNHMFLFLLSPVIGGLRFLSPKLKNKTDFIMSFVCAALIGLFFRMWI